MHMERTIGLKHYEPSHSISLCVVLLLSFVVSACSVDPSKQYTISVEYLPIELNARGVEDSTDYSTATVSITRVDVTETDEESHSELIVSPFRNGRVDLRGQIEHPMWVEVHVVSENAATPLKLRSFVEPGESVPIAVVDFKIPFYDDTIAHVGTSSNVQDQTKKFTLLADFNLSNFDTQNVIAEINIAFWNERGMRQWRPISSIVVQEGRFKVEMEVDDPIVLSIEIADLRSYYFGTRLIAEPGTTIRLEPSKRTAYTAEYLTTGWFQDRENTSERSQRQVLVAVADTGRHKRIVESWHRSFTYRLKQKLLDEALREESIRFNEQMTMRPHVEEASESQSEEILASHTETSWVKTDPMEGCEHVDLSKVRPDMWLESSDTNGSQSSALYDEIFNIEFTNLNDIARRARDPFDSLLALEFGAWYSLKDHSEVINILDRLALNVPPIVAEERIAPMRRFLSAIMQSEINEPLRVPGQKAPDFELSDLHGTARNLSEIFKENDLVFLEFIRSPEYYVDDSPTLSSSLYDEYNDAGLEIVTVLFNFDSDQEQELVANQNNTWIQLFDPHVPLDSDLAKSYAIVHRHVNYFIDSNGCIIQRSLRLADLRGFLNSYFDISPSSDPLEDVNSP
ncbi:MAG: redoxin domain-containing protein [Gammaproteobacteria bacterium]|nr:redoxin domain-containing protein [Gammaproteobacteria bacterium]MYF03299.1 redoxin domain-containing protein [Gammaproteobacteria bacterium]MYI76236.1 redoxin domain-containing protein [Gammaproteobacteria bacterium]